MKLSEYIKNTCFNVTDNTGNIYLKRYRLVHTRWFGIYLHNILRSDIDRCTHDHPWRFVTFILKNGYREILPNGIRLRRAGEFFFRPANFRHRLELTKPAWTLIVRGSKFKLWGFFTKFGWQQFKEGQVPICE